MSTRRALLAVLVATSLLSGVAVQPAWGATANPIVLENQQPGTTSWQFTDYNKAEAHQIEGYASLASVNKGGSISFMVSLSSSAQYTIDVYRMGWYPTGTNPDGTSCAPSCGGRLMQHIGPLNGFKQTTCPTVTTAGDQNFGMTECNWTPSTTITIPPTWTTGNYIAKLTRLDGTQLQNYLTFVVRDDASTAPVLYSLDVSTWQAYNFYGGRNLYGQFNDTTLASVGNSRAYTVSLDRPYLDQGSVDGAGNFMVWDFPLVRWMESQGYDMTYVTSVDLDANPNLLSGHRVFVNTGHDEYYSDNMRAAITRGIAAGTNLALFSANNFFHRITWGANGAGVQSRRVHTDKNALPGSTTYEWRYLTPSHPENEIGGVMLGGTADSRPFLVADASNWIFSGSGLSTYSGNGTTGVITSGVGQNALPGLVGYEFDVRAQNDPALSSYRSYEPPGTAQVGHSYVPAADNGVTDWSDATLYTAPSGAMVFSAGTLQWPNTLDPGFNDGFCSCGTNVVSAAGKRVTANILNRFVTPTTSASVALSPASLAFGSQLSGTASTPQTATIRNTGTGALSIAAIGVSGTDQGDFARTTTCPLSPATLAAGDSCTVSVTFAPSSGGAKSASVVITDNAADSPQSVALSGTGTVRAVSVTPASLSFGAQRTGTTSAVQTATVRNTGTATVTVASVSVSGDFAATSGCVGALAPGASCTASVTFSPTAAGGRSGTLSVADDAPGSPHTAALSGTGTAPAVSLAPASLDFGDQIATTTSAARSVTLSNTGTAALAIASISVGGANASDFGEADTCGASVAAGASCTIQLTFTPGATGARSAELAVTDDAGGSPHRVTLAGNGTPPAPAVALTPASVDFGGQRVNSAAPSRTATLTNTGTATLNIASIALAGANPADFAQSNDCPATLAPGAACVLTVGFAPTAAGGRAATVAIADDAAGSPQGLALRGTGTAPAVSPSPSALVFGTQMAGTTSAARTVSIQNTGTAPLTFGTPATTLTGADAGQFTASDDCPATLAAGASCTATVRFAPTAAGDRTATLSIADDASDAPQSVALSGTGTPPAPIASLAPSSLSYAARAVGSTSAAQTTVLSNTGTAPLTVASITIGGSEGGDYAQTNDCGATVAPGSSCTISVTFSPSATGTRSGTLSVTDDAPGSPQTATLTGTGTAPAASLTPASLTFGSQLVGTTSAGQAATLRNTGTATMNIASIGVTGANAGDFAQTNTCGATLAAGASCSVTVTFAPAAAGTRTAALRVSDDAPGSPHDLALTGSAVTGLPAMTLSPASQAFGRQVIGTTSAARSTTLTNSGNATMNIASIAVTGADAAQFAQTNTCGATLAPGASCTIAATFRPAAAGARAASVTITDDASGSPHAIALTGTGVYAAEDFESGSLSRWTVAGTGTAAAQTAQKHAGTYAGALTTSSTQSISMWSALSSAQTQTYTRFYFRWASLVGTVPIAWGTDANGKQLWEIDFRVQQRSPTVVYWNNAGTKTSFNTSSSSIPANQWHSIELRFNQGTSGYVEIWVDGTSMGSKAPNLSGALPYSRVYLANSAGGTAYFDDLFVTSTYTGP